MALPLPKLPADLLESTVALARWMLEDTLQRNGKLTKHQASTGLRAYLTGIVTSAQPTEGKVLELLNDTEHAESRFYTDLYEKLFVTYGTKLSADWETMRLETLQAVRHILAEDQLLAPILRLACARADAGPNGIQVRT
jgi:hypothetical protein